MPKLLISRSRLHENMKCKEWFGLTTGWANRFLCHHCSISHTEPVVTLPSSVLDAQSRRDLVNFVAECMRPGSPRYLGAKANFVYDSLNPKP